MLGRLRSSAIVAIVGARIVTGAGPTIERGTVLVEAGKIKAVGADVAVPGGATRVEASGKTLLPGFIDVSTSLGLVEVSLSPPENDIHESSNKVTPAMRAIDGLNIESRAIAVARMGGVTSVVALPRWNVIAGTSVMYKVSGELPPGIVLSEPAAMHFFLGEAARGRAKAPESRMGIAATVRSQLVAARRHFDDMATFLSKFAEWTKASADAGAGAAARADGGAIAKEPEPPKRDLGLEALSAVVAGRTLAVFHADRASDILSALRIIAEFNLRAAISGAAEGWRVAAEIAAARVPVIVAPVRRSPDRMETQSANLRNAAILNRALVTVLIGSDDVFNVRNLPYEAGFAVTYGLPRDVAIAAITREPARLFRVDARTGTIEVGKDADLVLWDGDPLDTDGRPTQLWIGGKTYPIPRSHGPVDAR